MAFEFVARNGILSLSDITGSAGLQLTGLSVDNTATTGLFKDGNDAVVTRAFGDLAFVNGADATVATASYVAVGNIDGTIDISDQTNLAGGTNLTLNGDTMNLDANISLTSVTASLKGNVDGNVTGNVTGDLTGNASSATKVKTSKDDTSTADHYLTFVDSNNTAATAEDVHTNTDIKIKPSTGGITATSFTGSLKGNVAGNVTGNVTGNLTGDVTGNVTGNADTATSASHVAAAYDTVSVSNATITLTDMAGSGDSITVNNVEDAVSASYALTASYAANAGLSITTKNDGNDYAIVFHDSAGETLATDGTLADFKYRPSTNTLTVGNTVVPGELAAVTASIGSTSVPGIFELLGGNASSNTYGIDFIENSSVRGSVKISNRDMYFKLDDTDSQSTARLFYFGHGGNDNVLSINSESGNLFVSGTLEVNDIGSAQAGTVSALFEESGVLKKKNLGTAALQATGSMTVKTADTVNLTGATADEEYRVTMADESGLTGEALYVDSGITFNPSINKLTVSGDTAIGGNGSVTGDLTVGGTLTAQEFRTEYLTQVVIAQSGSTKLGNTPDDIHEVTGSLSVSENISLGSELFVSASSVGSVTNGTNAIVAEVPFGPGYGVTAVHFDYKLYKSGTGWYRTGTVMAVGKSGATIHYTDTSTNEPLTNNGVLSCDEASGNIRLNLDNSTGATLSVDVHIRRF